MRFGVFALNKADEKRRRRRKRRRIRRRRRERKARGERQNAKEGIRTFKMRYFIVASLAVKRAPRASTVKKTKTTATTTAMKRAVGPWVTRVCSKLHENLIVVCWLEAFVGRQRRIKVESAKGPENYYNGKGRIGRVVAAAIRSDAICTCCRQHSLCIKLY